MKPYYVAPDGQTIYVGDVRDVLRQLPDESVQCCVTSPPYWGLRDYGTATWEGGDPECDHKQVGMHVSPKSTLRNDGRMHTGPYEAEKAMVQGPPYADVCRRCGARRIDQQIGLEATPDAYVATMVSVFREIRRVLRGDGVVFGNWGDSYAHNGACGGGSPDGPRKPRATDRLKQEAMNYRVPPGLKPKDLCMIPARVALALQDDGWWLRSDIIWAKRAPMPESVTDRPTSAYEHVFLLAKSANYWYDADAVREESTAPVGHYDTKVYRDGGYFRNGIGSDTLGGGNPAGRNQRNFWLLGPEPYPEAHFATFPTEIPRRAILAGTSERGCCPKCGRAWERVTETTRGQAPKPVGYFADLHKTTPQNTNGHGSSSAIVFANSMQLTQRGGTPSQTLGFRAACSCGAGDPVPCTVLDPFLGSGTSLLVARQLGRAGIGIELNPTYAELAVKRLESQTLSLFALEAR